LHEPRKSADQRLSLLGKAVTQRAGCVTTRIDKEMQGKSTVRSSIVRILLPIMGGLIVVATSFFATMQILDYWLTPPDPNTSVIHVVEATYGLSCKDFTPPAGYTNLVKVGNVTETVAKACDGARTTCLFPVDVEKFGDPANGCGKDFNVRWRCDGESEVHRFYLTSEASGRTALLACPAS
jgi:hypothetical protein